MLFGQIFDGINLDLEIDNEGPIKVSGINEWATVLKNKYMMTNNYYYENDLSDLLTDQFGLILHELADNYDACTKLCVHWNLEKKPCIQDLFKSVMKKIFINDGDHSFINSILNKNETMMISLQVTNRVSEITTIIGFVSITTVKHRKKIVLVIVDYFGVTEKHPKEVLSSFQHARFRGKGIGKFLLHIVQNISKVLCDSDDNVILLKCNAQVSTYYESIGFKGITSNSK